MDIPVQESVVNGRMLQAAPSLVQGSICQSCSTPKLVLYFLTKLVSAQHESGENAIEKFKNVHETINSCCAIKTFKKFIIIRYTSKGVYCISR